MNNTFSNLYHSITSQNYKNTSSELIEGIISNIKIKKNKTMEISAIVSNYPNCKSICMTEETFETILDVYDVLLIIHLPPDIEISIIDYIPWALRHFEKENFYLASFLKSAKFVQINETNIDIILHEGCDDIAQNGFDVVLHEFFKKTMDKDIEFSIIENALSIDDAIMNSIMMTQEFANKKRESSEAIVPKQPSKSNNDSNTSNSKTNNDKLKRKEKDNNTASDKLGANIKIMTPANQNTSDTNSKKDYKKAKQPDGVIWGRMNTDLKIMTMDTLNNETGLTMIEGFVFAIESRYVSNGTKVLLKFCLTDKTNSIRCTAFMRPEEAIDFEENYKKAFIRVCAEVGFDTQYEKDLVGKIIGIQTATPPKPKGDHSENKRVELHCHTKMSSKDSVCEVSDIIKLAVHYGHEAVAITDHGVVQAFPDARSAQVDAKKKGKDIKIIYGVECYLVDDGNCVAYMCDDESLNNGFVTISIETTGDNPSVDRINKIDAVLYTNKNTITNNETDNNTTKRYNNNSFFVPTIKKSWSLNKCNTDCNTANTNSETAINDSDTTNNDYFHLEVLSEVSNFIEERPIVAHNALKVCEFLRYEGFRTKKEEDPRIKFFGPLIDTKSIAEILYPQINNTDLSGIYEFLNSINSDKNSINFEFDSSSNTNASSIFDKCIITGEFFNYVMSSKNLASVSDLNYLSGNITDKSVLTESKNHYHCILLAKDYVGLYGIYRIVSQSHLKFIYRERPRVTRSVLEFYRSGNIIGSACEAGELFMGVMDYYDKHGKDFVKAKQELESCELKKIADFYDYLEIQPVGNNQFMLRTTERKGQILPSKYQSVEDLKNLNKIVYEVGRIMKKPVCATCDVHFLQPSDSVYREIMQSDMGFSDASSQAPLYFRTTDEMLSEFSYLGDTQTHDVVIENPKYIASLVKPDMKPFPDGTYPPIIDTAAEDVENLTWSTAQRIYGKDGVLPSIVEKRIEKELKSIIGNGFAIMYYIAHKLVKKSNDDGYIVGSRGSVGSSFVATLCGITEVNPLEAHYYCPYCQTSEFITTGEFSSGYDMPPKNCPNCNNPLCREGQDIPFETFLGFDGDKQPDIDLNFSGEYQPRAHKFIEEMFGASHTFRAGTISGYAEKNAISMVNKFCMSNTSPVTKAESLRLANGLIGVKRTTGQHPGGIVVVPKERDIYDFTPVQCPADKTESGTITTHFDFNSLHDTILKLDILGHDDPTMLKVLGDMTSIDVRTIPIPDDQVMELFLSTKSLNMIHPTTLEVGTLGLPELGTFMARGMIKETKPTRFYDLVQLMGLSHGTDVWKGNAQDLIKSGTCNISQVIGCRDSIMTSLMYYGLPPKAAFNIMEKVRKGKGLSDEQEAMMKEFNVPEWYIESCKKIKYMFPKAHAAAYSISALRIAWFKVYYKVEYYCAFFTVRADEFDARLMCKGIDTIRHYKTKLYSSFKDKEKIIVKVFGKEEEFSSDKAQRVYYILELIEEMYCRGVEFLPVDIYESDATNFKKVSETIIRPPLNKLPSLSDVVANNIVNARNKNAKFLSREDFANKANIGDSLLAMLSAQGCLDELPETTQIDFFSIM